MTDHQPGNASQFEERVRGVFQEKLRSRDVSAAIAAIKTLLELIRKGKESTYAELVQNLNIAMRVMAATEETSITSTTSGSELFMRVISNIKDERRDESFDLLKKLMLDKGDKFVKIAELSRQKIARNGGPHIKENATILVHSRSRVVLELLSEASKTKKFKVYVTESNPDGATMVQELIDKKIDGEMILDSAMGYIMERIDLVLVGAEGVLASGGIINKIGTFSMAMAAKAFNKPVYVAAESFKFSNLYPLNQRDIPNEYSYGGSLTTENDKRHPMIDYTPPEYLTLLFTDIGILTPIAVSDELIKLA